MSEVVMENATPTKPVKEKRKKSKAVTIVEWVLFAIFGALFAFIIAGNIEGMVNKKKNYGQSIRFGVGSFIVLTDSMEPEIPKQSAILTYKEDVKTFASRLEKGETIDVTFANVAIDYYVEPDNPDYKNGQLVVSNQIMTHRLMEVHIDTSVAFGKGRYIFVAAGINHQGELSKKGQFQLFTEVQYLGTVKVANKFLGGVFNFIVSPVGLIILLLIPAAYLIVVSSIDIFKAMKQSEEGSETVEGEKLAKLSADDRERLKKELLDEMIKAKKEAKKDEGKN